MENDSTTDVTDNQTDADNANQTDQSNTTEQQTDANTNDVDNLKKSDSTDDSNDDSGDDNSSAPKFDTDLDEWAEKTKRPTPTTDRERELYQEIRNGQREFSRSKQAKESTSTVDAAIAQAKPADNKTDDDDERDPVEVRQDNLEARLAESEALRVRSEYFTDKSVDKATADEMGKILQEKVERAKTPEAKKQAFDYWTHPDQLDDWHALAKARSVTSDTTVIEEEAARKERARIAKESQAAGTGRNATTTTEKKTGYDRRAYLASDD